MFMYLYTCEHGMLLTWNVDHDMAMEYLRLGTIFDEGEFLIYIG